jgi:hypothetical protein
VTEQATIPAAGGAVIPPEKITPVPGAPQDAVQPTPAEKAPGDEPEAEKKGTEGEGEEDKRQRTDRYNRRIGQLTQQRNDYRARYEAEAEKNRRLSQPIAPQNVADLDYDQRDSLRTREAIRAERADEALSEAQRAEYESMAATAEIAATKIQAADDPELDPILNDVSFPLTDDITEFLAESEHTVELARHLVKNPALARRLAHMTFRGDRQNRGTATRASMREADRILVGLEERLKAGGSLNPASRKATKAPAPGTTLNGGSPLAAQAPLNELPMDQYLERRKAAWAKGQP